MRVLAVLYCFPPLLVPAAVRHLKLVLGLRELGVEVEPIIIDPRSFASPGNTLVDPALARLVPPDLITHVVWSPENHPAVRLLKKYAPVRNALRGIFEPKKREWTVAARRTLRGLDLGRYDVLLSCSQPHSNHLLGLELRAKTGLPWVTWFGDPWSRNPYARPSTPGIAAYHRELETRVLTEADYVFYTSEEMLRLAMAEHGPILSGKSGVLPHLFVPAWYGACASVLPRRARVEMLHTGHFYGHRTPRPLLEVLGRLHRETPLEGALHIASYGSLGDADLRRVRELNLESIFETFPPVPYLESLALMKGADALLLIDAKLTNTEESVFLPSKLIDYLGSGKPVVALTPLHGASARVVSAAGGTTVDVEDEAAIEGLMRGILKEGVAPGIPREAEGEYHYRSVAAKLIGVLEEAVRRRAAPVRPL